MFILQIGPTHEQLVDSAPHYDKRGIKNLPDMQRRACVLADFAYQVINNGTHFGLYTNAYLVNLPVYREALQWVDTPAAKEVSCELDRVIAGSFDLDEHAFYIRADSANRLKYEEAMKRIEGEIEAASRRVQALQNQLLKDAEVRFGGEVVGEDVTLGFDPERSLGLRSR